MEELATLAICLAAALGGAGSAISLRAVWRAGVALAGGAGFAMRGQDVEAEIALTLEEAHRGVKRTITLQAMETCTDCRGSGTKDNDCLRDVPRRRL